MNFSHFKLAYKSFMIVLTLTIILVVILWIKNSAQYFLSSQILDLVLDEKIKGGYEKAINILKIWGIDTLSVFLKLVVLKGIGSVVKRIVVPSSWIAHWDNVGDITTVFGRNLIKYFRHHTLINFREIVNISDYSQNELKTISHHNKNPNMVALFKKYDIDFEFDIKNKEILEMQKLNSSTQQSEQSKL